MPAALAVVTVIAHSPRPGGGDVPSDERPGRPQRTPHRDTGANPVATIVSMAARAHQWATGPAWPGRRTLLCLPVITQPAIGGPAAAAGPTAGRPRARMRPDVDSRRLRRPDRAAVLIATCVLAVTLAAGCAPGASHAPDVRGQRLEVAAVWSGVEQQRFGLVLRAFTRRTGVTVRYTSAGYSVPAFLRTRLAAGRLPDVVFLPQPGLLRTYAAEHLLVPLNRIAGGAVASN